MAKGDLLARFIEEEKKETQLMEELLLLRRKNKRLGERLGRELGLVTTPEAKPAPPKIKPSAPAESLNIICLNCGGPTPSDSTKCVHCDKNPRRKEGERG